MNSLDATPLEGTVLLPAPALRPQVPAGERAVGEDVEKLYVQYRVLLLSVACRKFHVPPHDAEALLQEVFLSFLQAGTRIDNVKGWLVAAVCNACRYYRREHKMFEPLPDDYLEEPDPLSDSLLEKRALELTIRKALGYLQPRCRETLRLHFFEGRAASDVGRELDTTTRYAEKLIANCLKRVREIYIAITAVRR